MISKPRNAFEGPALGEDRRREKREPASGEGWMEWPEGGARRKFHLIDVSVSGFRGRHRCMALQAGQKVRFHHPRAKGEALVMWNRLLGGEVESGFLIVPRI